MDFIEMFEKIIAKYTGFKYAVSVDNCTNGIILSMQCLLINNKITKNDVITIPCNTYLSIPMTLKMHNWKIKFSKIRWKGKYRIGNTTIYDAANDFKENMIAEYQQDDIVCVSF